MAKAKRQTAQPKEEAPAQEQDEQVQEVDGKTEEQTSAEREQNRQRDLARLRQRPPASFAEQLAESREALKEPLQPGMKFFESPQGFIIVAEATQHKVWCPQENGGKGMWIVPLRVAGAVRG